MFRIMFKSFPVHCIPHFIFPVTAAELTNRSQVSKVQSLFHCKHTNPRVISQMHHTRRYAMWPVTGLFYCYFCPIRIGYFAYFLLQFVSNLVTLAAQRFHIGYITHWFMSLTLLLIRIGSYNLLCSCHLPYYRFVSDTLNTYYSPIRI